MPREGFDGPVPNGRYADETPYVEAIPPALGNIDVDICPQRRSATTSPSSNAFFLALEAPVRNPTNLGWMLAISRLARAQGRRVLLGGLYGNFTISWFGWSQTARSPAARARCSPPIASGVQYYRIVALFALGRLPQAVHRAADAGPIGEWADRRRRHGLPALAGACADRPEFARRHGSRRRARAKAGHDFLYRARRGERAAGLDSGRLCWRLAGSARRPCTGVEVRDPTADIDVVAYCFGVPPEQYLAEGIDRSLIRRAMWGLLPDSVLANRLNGLQSADWYEKLERRRDQLAADIAELSASPLARKAIDLARLERAIQNWPAGGWQTQAVIEEYHFALTRGVAGARFLRWIESANR